MHVEIQVALNFFISFLYNKLPRRRVNQFGEELEKALKQKFQGHWYPEKPYKGSAFRCIKTAPPLDPVFDIAAQESGMALADIQENLPEELSIWIDPGEVSYRLGEKGVVKILYSESESAEDRADREIYRTFNPEAQCFRPIVDPQGSNGVTTQLGSLSLSSGSSSSSPFGHSPSPTASYKAASSSSPINGFLAKSTAPLTFTTATFAQTKFGSTKLKTNGKRSHRMSPTEFSSYIKQRAIIQQQQQQQHTQQQQVLFAASLAQQQSQTQQAQQRPRSLSPTPATNIDANSFLLLASAANMHQHNHANFAAPSQSHFSPRSQGLFDGYLTDIFASNTNSQQELLANSNSGNSNTTKVISPRALPNMAAVTANANALSLFFDNKAILNNSSVTPTNAGVISFSNATAGESTNSTTTGKGFDNNLNFNVGGVSYPNQHLLMAN